jgi:glycerol dehydrogenase-like iron-containing ADH family enzyme
MSSYDAWKTRSDWDEEARYYSGPSNETIRQKVEQLTRDIDWLTTKLANLSLSDEDFDQTQDYIFELRQERESLKRCFNV